MIINKHVTFVKAAFC